VEPRWNDYRKIIKCVEKIIKMDRSKMREQLVEMDALVSAADEKGAKRWSDVRGRRAPSLAVEARDLQKRRRGKSGGQGLAGFVPIDMSQRYLDFTATPIQA
jgi:hypothetical protein